MNSFKNNVSKSKGFSSLNLYENYKSFTSNTNLNRNNIINNNPSNTNLNRNNIINNNPSNFLSSNKINVRIENTNENNIEFRNLPKEIKKKISSSIHCFSDKKFLYEERPIFYDKLYNTIKLKSQKNSVISNVDEKIMPINNKTGKSKNNSIHSFTSSKKFQLFNDSQKDKNSNSDVNKINKTKSFSFINNKEKNKIQNFNCKINKNKKASKKLKNISKDHLKDLLEIKKDIIQIKEFPINPFQEAMFEKNICNFKKSNTERNHKAECKRNVSLSDDNVDFEYKNNNISKDRFENKNKSVNNVEKNCIFIDDVKNVIELKNSQDCNLKNELHQEIVINQKMNEEKSIYVCSNNIDNNNESKICVMTIKSENVNKFTNEKEINFSPEKIINDKDINLYLMNKLNDKEINVSPDKDENFSCELQYDKNDIILNSPEIRDDLNNNKITQNIFNNNIIKNAQLRENIKHRKIKPKNEEEESRININMYKSEFIEGRNEIMKLYLENKICNSPLKIKTPKNSNSKIGVQNKIINSKKFLTIKPNILTNKSDNINSKDELEEIELKYRFYIQNFYKKKEKFPQFFQINNLDDAMNIKLTNKNMKRLKLNFLKDNVIKSELIEDNFKSMKERINYLIGTNTIVYNNILYKFKNEEKATENNEVPSKSESKKDIRKKDINKKNEKLKVFFNKYEPKDYEDQKKISSNDYCNTSNDLVNNSDFYNLEKKKTSNKFLKPCYNTFKSNENNDIKIIQKKNKSFKKIFIKNKFIENINFINNKKSFNNVKGKNYKENADIDHLYQYKKNLNKFESEISAQPKIRNLNNNTAIMKNDYFSKEPSKNKFKILKKQLKKDSEKVLFVLENLKKTQSELDESKRKFLVDSVENKLKRDIRSSNLSQDY